MNHILQLLPPVRPLVPVSRTGAGDPKSYGVTGILSVNLPHVGKARYTSFWRLGLHSATLAYPVDSAGPNGLWWRTWPSFA
jgi:hypothetical protein